MRLMIRFILYFHLIFCFWICIVDSHWYQGPNSVTRRPVSDCNHQDEEWYLRKVYRPWYHL